jgi:hypothetical protein
MELSPEQEPMEGIMAISFLESSDKDLEEVAKDFFEEIEQPRNPLPLAKTQEPPKSPVELKPLPLGLKYAFLNENNESPMTISDKLFEYETIRLLTILEKHHSAFGYLLQDLKWISPALCTHRIPIDPSYTPSREPQCRLNNAMRDVIKKEVLKLLHARIIYLVPNSEWVSSVQVVPKKGGMTMVKNERNELIPQRTITEFIFAQGRAKGKLGGVC